MTQLSIDPGLLTETIVFCRTLREHGLAVTPSETIDAITALNLIDRSDRRETFLSLRSVLTSRIDDYPVFEELFKNFWDRSGRNLPPRKDESHEARAKRKEQTSTGLDRQKDLAFLIEHWGSSKSTEPLRLPGASNLESADEKDFSLFAADELEEVSRLARRVVRRLARTPSRRWKTARHGTRVDLRRTFRNSLSTGGEIVDLAFKRRKRMKTKLVVICDVSGSMDIYSRILLQFVYGLQNSFAQVESFVFSTSLERITTYLKDANFKQVLQRLANNVRGWSGGTLIGQSIADFNSKWTGMVDKRTIVIILSDGWDTGEPDVLTQALAHVKRRAGKLIWLNPLLGSPDYQPIVRGMQAALPQIDIFAPLHNLDSLRALERHLIL
jgi:uncharacterized protein with von Willebrand factor type A (vWA) domain